MRGQLGSSERLAGGAPGDGQGARCGEAAGYLGGVIRLSLLTVPNPLGQETRDCRVFRGTESSTLYKVNRPLRTTPLELRVENMLQTILTVIGCAVVGVWIRSWWDGGEED